MIEIPSRVQQIIFDFDSTLFDTETLKKVLWKIAALHGYNEQQAQIFYNQARAEGEKITIALESYLAAVREHAAVDGHHYDNYAVEVAMNEAQNARLLPGAEALLQFCAEKNVPQYLLSLGVEEWQQLKVHRSGADKYFEKDHIIFTDKINVGKEEVIDTLFGKDFTGIGTVLFNDKPDETAHLLAHYPQLVAFVRREHRDTRFNDVDFNDLETRFPGRVTWSDSLENLQKILETLF